MSYTFELTTRYSDTAQDKIIHHSSYIVYLEEARLAYMQSKNFFIHELEAKGYTVPVVNLSINYIKPLLSLQNIVIQVKTLNITKVRFTFSYQIFCNQILVTEAISEHCLLDEKFKPMRLPLEFRNIFLQC